MTIKGTLHSCYGMIKDKGKMGAVFHMMDKVREEHNELEVAWYSYQKEPTGKNRQKMGEEAVDAINSLITLLDALAHTEGCPEGFTEDCINLVSSKLHARGYYRDF